MVLIDYKNVDVYHNDGDAVLRGVDFHVEEGEFIYLIGQVGAGKSSLLKTFYVEMDIEKADCANVLGYDLMSIRRKQIPELRRKMGIIFQDLQLLSDRNVYQNLCFVLKATGWKGKKEIRQRVEEVLEQVGMADKKDRMPHELSGGEQQRIALARLMMKQCRLILAYEPTGSLDCGNALQVMEILHSFREMGKTVIMVTHDPTLIDDSMRRIDLNLLRNETAPETADT
jgi:cell division transport system ATP-binding protein